MGFNHQRSLREERDMKRRKTFRLIIALIFFSGLFYIVRGAMATEEAKYSVLEKQNNFELRQYEPQIVAETFVEGDFKEVGNEGFRRLFGYISGNNRSGENERKMADHLSHAPHRHHGYPTRTAGYQSKSQRGSWPPYGRL
jgi:hypothetical protein